MAISAAIAAAIHPIIGMFIMATPTDLHAVVAVVANVENDALAIVPNAFIVPPPVSISNINTAIPLIAFHSPTVANRTTAKVARPIFTRKPLEANCPVVAGNVVGHGSDKGFAMGGDVVKD